MKVSKRYAEAMERARLTPQYWAERAMLDLSYEVGERMKKKGLTQKALADAVGCKPAFVSRVLSGRHNVTVETLSTVALGLGMHIEVRLEDNKEPLRAHSFTYAEEHLPNKGVMVKSIKLVAKGCTNESFPTIFQSLQKAA